MKDRSILAGHAACFAAYAIFGINIIVCKDLTGGHLISPIAIFTLRSLGAGLLFWLLSMFIPAEKVDRRDCLKIFAAAFLGYFMTQLTFLMAIPDVTPMHCSIMSSMSPIYTMFIAAIVLKEPLSWQKAGGILTRMDKNPFRTDVGAGVSDRVRHIHGLFPYPIRTEAYPSYPCQHVQLYPADHRYRHKHHHRYGHPYMAETPRRTHGIRGRLRRQPRQTESLTY